MKKIETISFTTKTTAVLNVLGMFVLLIGAALFGSVVGSTSEFPLGLVGSLIVFLLTGVIHELLHGVGFLLGGVKPAYGAGVSGFMPYFYATSKQKVRLKPMLVTAYLPFVLLSVFFIVLGLAFPEYRQIATIGFVANFTGAVGDLWVASKLWKYLRFKDVMVLDKRGGIEVYN